MFLDQYVFKIKWQKKHVLKTVVFCAFFRVLFSPRHVWAEFEKSEPARSNRRILDNFLTVVLSRYLKLYHQFSFYSENILKATELNDFNRMIWNLNIGWRG